MTLTIRSRAITEDRLREIAGATSTYGSSLPVDRLALVAEVQRRDYAHLLIEGTRGSDGIARYFARLDRGAGVRGAEGATSFDVGGRTPLDVGGERIIAVYYGDEDGDGSRDVIVRLEEGGLLVFLVTEAGADAVTRPPTGAPSSMAPDPGGTTQAPAGGASARGSSDAEVAP